MTLLPLQDSTFPDGVFTSQSQSPVLHAGIEKLEALVSPRFLTENGICYGLNAGDDLIFSRSLALAANNESSLMSAE